MARRRRVRPASALESLSPLWILSQIILLQAAFYVVAAILFLFTTLVLGSAFSLDLMFSWVPLQADNAVGWTLAMVWICNSLTNVISITLLIIRTKFVLDFALTIHFIHLIITSLYSHSLPSSWLWWAVQLGSSLITISLASWLCQKRELRPLNWGGGGAGRGRSRTVGNREAGQGHEMVPLKGDQEVP
ncbi:hypothetical protein TWF173_001628 [Orbilia oligospora]|uniref:Uncharacterized protein n=2 Tax=Orbilia oligospora TaxID=2813651 RepID=G1XIN7_ARTOA|nr:hypothetical protein AOL_s00097g214 [Orbilia oligospora ATCC 24927]EGX46975.1 hypothetical protein AOL_s00097g214 [Orbilia oligospora ATCC 24927]KAF3273523.1 hypothetical protein TWF970_009042 [Orbilia oligospora]KAF3308215.1 hypothetical protein TWF173_001628 [Orbilia oligospora]